MNTIIGNMFSSKKSQTQNHFDIKESNLSPSNINKDGKYIVPYSITNSHIIKDLKQYEEENAGGKRKKKITYNAKSAGKIKRKKGKKNPPTFINIIASIAQELIDNDEDLKEFKSISPDKNEITENNIYSQSEGITYDNRKFNIGTNENISYGKIDLNEMKIDTEQEKNIISKYNLIENNFNTEFEEQVPFYY